MYGKEGPAVVGVPALRTRAELRQSSAWMGIIQDPQCQGFMQALNSRRQRVLADERYLQAPEAIDRVMAYSLAIVDHPEDVAGEFAFAIDLELDYLMDHYHGRVYSGLAGSTLEHDPDIYEDRLAGYRSLEVVVQEFAMLATHVGCIYHQGNNGKRLAAAQSVERALGFTTGRTWPDVSLGPEVTAINPDHFIDLMVDRQGNLILPPADSSGSMSSESFHEGL